MYVSYHIHIIQQNKNDSNHQRYKSDPVLSRCIIHFKQNTVQCVYDAYLSY